MLSIELAIAKASQLIKQADALLITAGAGIGVDSGLPDFRGNEGFWKAYPALQQSGYQFTSIANPYAFFENPETAWGFYGHRLNLYRATAPHAGFQLLRAWAESKADGYFVYTSNVDGQFQKAGFNPNRLVECHGSIHHLQCLGNCNTRIWSADGLSIKTNDALCKSVGPLPTCPVCGGLARPNVLMFDDWHWFDQRTEAQMSAFRAWVDPLKSHGKKVVIVEIGAGFSIPRIRMLGQQLPFPLIRINPSDEFTFIDKTKPILSIPMAALAGLQAIDSFAEQSDH